MKLEDFPRILSCKYQLSILFHSLTTFLETKSVRHFIKSNHITSIYLKLSQNIEQRDFLCSRVRPEPLSTQCWYQWSLQGPAKYHYFIIPQLSSSGQTDQPNKYNYQSPSSSAMVFSFYASIFYITRINIFRLYFETVLFFVNTKIIFSL